MKRGNRDSHSNTNSIYCKDEYSSSDETLVYRRSENNDSSDVSSLLTENSEVTLANCTRLFRQPISKFSAIKEFVLASSFLSNGVYVFPSMYAAQQHTKKRSSEDRTQSLDDLPLLQTSTSMLSIFKKNSPFMTIHSFVGRNQKETFCKVYFKILSKNLTCYILAFNLHQQDVQIVVLLNNGTSPCVDLEYEGTRLRVNGVTGTTSTFGNGLIRMFLLKDNVESLSDDLRVEGVMNDLCESIKNIKIQMSETNDLYNSLKRGDRSVSRRTLSESNYLVNLPLASFVDAGDEKIKGSNLFKNGTIRVFSQPIDPRNDVTSLVITSILLVLREQEIRKNKGNNKPSFIATDN
ncbi:Piso0_002463 [Millerozyma farinosa CBS 7064]|uniref:Piso0_002463 protein n=1 Tax=Pichia sorbitophila (strain ATCC MYA-4447 / BCRC 22081 / CBS 7064 / NBRC 10061 / NRRL Y-12695) TaxID=559304 RepID=G8YCP0_PICSO|nr:Piso0_002463 [Millerozyma farinosa CBS 7064]